MKRFFILTLLLIPSMALAQQQTLEQRIGAQIGALVIQNASLQLQIEQLQESLKASQARVRVLEDKYEPKKDAPK